MDGHGRHDRSDRSPSLSLRSSPDSTSGPDEDASPLTLSSAPTVSGESKSPTDDDAHVSDKDQGLVDGSVDGGDNLTRTSTRAQLRRLERQSSSASGGLTSHRLHRFQLYETNARYFIVGADITDKYFKVLKLDRTSPPGQLNLFEDDISYNKSTLNQLLITIDDGNKATGGLRLKCTFWGLVGFIRFTDSYYMMLITKRQQVAVLGGHYTYQIEATELVPITTGAGARFAQSRNPEEARFLNILSNLDLSKNFYFSHTYNITRTLQDNIIRERKAVLEGVTVPIRDYNQMFVWNDHLLSPVGDSLGNMYDWCVPIVHGFISQASINVFGRLIYVTIIGRRSRFFAGARFLKRGVNDLGYVANDVETEQIVSDMLTTSFHAPGPRLFSNPTYTSYVHHRGSIPLYWTQDNSGVSPKPAIDLNLTDPFFQPAALHFNNLFARYGCPIYVLNLIKARERTPRESKLLYELQNAVEYLNQFLPPDKQIIYKAFDMSRAAKTRGGDVIGSLEKIAGEILDLTGFFHNGSPSDETHNVQNGVARTNCIDCLDRTNAAQFVIGKYAFGLQLKALGVINSHLMDYDSDAMDMFTHMFHNHGDTIAVQYGGSHLVNTMATYRKINHWQGHGRDMVESFKRYYHNSFLDSQRQEAHNLFLGNYIYAQGQPMLWDLATDYYLHHSDPRGFLDRTRSRNSYINWFDPANLEPRHLPPLSSGLVESTKKLGVVDYDDFWLEYYRPLILSSFQKVYAYRLNTDKEKILAIDRPSRDPTLPGYDASPFIPRIDPSRPPAPDSPGKKPRKGVTIVDPNSEAEQNEQAGSHSPMARDTSVGAGILVHPPIAVSKPNDPLVTPMNAMYNRSEKEEKSLWTLNKIYENSLNPAVSAAEAAEYNRYVTHPSNIPLVVSEDGIEESHSRIAIEYAEYAASGNVAGSGFTWDDQPTKIAPLRKVSWDAVDGDVQEFREFVGVGDREDALTVFDEDRDKKRYKAYRQWLVKGKNLFKQIKVDSEYKP